MAERFIKVARVGDIPPGTARVVDLDDGSLAVCNVNGQFYALDNVCTHEEGPLGDGEVIGYAIECPRHGAQFDVRTGEVLAPPAVAPVKPYKVRTKDGSIEVSLDS